LLAHELTHTVQQSGGSTLPQRALRVSQPGDHLEREAERVASRVVDGAGSSGPITRVGGGLAQRLEFPSWEDVEDAAGAAYDTVADTAEGVGEAVVEGAEWVGEQAGEALDAAGDAANWVLSAAGQAAMAGVEALVGMFGGSITVSGTCIVVTIPSIPLFPSFQTTLGQTPVYPYYLPFLAGAGAIGPVPIAGSLGFLATIQGSIEAAVGPGEIRGINLTVCPLSGSATATGQLYAAAAIGPRLTMFGGLAGGVGALLPFTPPIPVIVIAQGGLRGIVTGWGVGAIQDTVTLGYSIGGGLTFNNVTELMAGVLIQGDLDLYAALRLYDKVICDYAYRLGHWETGAAYQLTIPIHAGLSGAGGTGGVGPITHGPMPIGSIVTAIMPPPVGLNCMSWQQIKKFLCDNGIIPEEYCADDDADPEVQKNVLAVAICKCVGDTSCGAGIYKKCFTVSEKTCRDGGKMQKLADKCCNHDPDLTTRCNRDAGCRFRHTDYKCPVDESACTHGHCAGGGASGAGPAAAGCTITTRTLAAAPDGTASTRKRVGVNERVEMTASEAVNWSASGGTVAPATGTSTIWTAPITGGSCTVTGTPTGGGSACTVSMDVEAPNRRDLTVTSPQGYSAGQAGSGFFANVVVAPTRVSFSRIEVREDAVAAKATGYYDTVLGWNGAMHPVGTWLPLDAANNGLSDRIGTVPPGTPPPFSKGRFHWPIPQRYRLPGSGGGFKYSTGDHIQDMAGATGEETTSKEGATRTRTP
jgi:hypothetical protein